MHSALALIVTVITFGFADPRHVAPSTLAPPKAEHERIFILLDKNTSGFLDLTEFLGGRVGKAADNKRDQYIKWDLDNDHKLTLEEFLKKGNRSPGQFYPKLEFERRDQDRDQYLTIDEFLLYREGAPAIYQKRFEAIDQNSDSKITLLEYTSKHEQWQRQEQWNSYRKWLGYVLFLPLLLLDLLVTVMLGLKLAAWIGRPQVEVATVAATAKPPRSRNSSHSAIQLTTPKAIDEFEVS